MALRKHFQEELDEFRTELNEMASLVLRQVERAIAIWEAPDSAAAESVIAADDDVDRRCAHLDELSFTIQVREAPVASDQRLMHVGLISAIALERVGDLAVTIARQSRSAGPAGSVPEVRAHLQAMGRTALDALGLAVSALEREDVEVGDRAAARSREVAEMLDTLLQMVVRSPEDADTRAWLARAVLVGRHFERVANNAGELGGRVRFLATGRREPEGGA